MHTAVKVLFGLILIIIGLSLLVDSALPLSGTTGTFGINWFDNLVTVLTGVIPLFLLLIGLFVVWLEIDELKAQKEMKEEEAKEKEPKEKK